MWESGESEEDTGTGGGNTGSGGRKQSDNSSMAAALVLATQLGFSVACPMVIFIGGGAWLDSRIGWGPWLLFVGVILGIASAGALFFQIAKTPVSRRQKSGSDLDKAPYKVEEPPKLRMRDLGKPPTDKIDGNGH